MTYFTTPTTQKARKPHVCSNCWRKIDPGESYYRTRGFDGGDAWTFKQCAHCESVTKLYDPRDSDDMISVDGHLCWAEDRPRDWAEARAMIGFKAQWRYLSGRLMPIPGGES